MTESETIDRTWFNLNMPLIVLRRFKRLKQLVVSLPSNLDELSDVFTSLVQSWSPPETPQGHLYLFFSPLGTRGPLNLDEAISTRQEYLHCVRRHVGCAVETLLAYPPSRMCICKVFVHALTDSSSGPPSAFPFINVIMYAPLDGPEGPTICDEVQAMFPAAIKEGNLMVSTNECKQCSSPQQIH